MKIFNIWYQSYLEHEQFLQIARLTKKIFVIYTNISYFWKPNNNYN